MESGTGIAIRRGWKRGARSKQGEGERNERDGWEKGEGRRNYQILLLVDLSPMAPTSSDPQGTVELRDRDVCAGTTGS